MKPTTLYLLLLGTRRFCYSAGLTLFAIYLIRVVGTNPLELVMPGVVYELSILLFEIPTGVVADVYSRRLSVIIAYALMGCGFLIAGLVSSLLVVLTGFTIMGIGSTFVSGALSAWLVDEVGLEKASETFLRGAQVSLIARFSGIVLSVVIGMIHLQLTIIIAGIPFLMMSVLMMFIMPETGFQAASSSERESWRDLFQTLIRGIDFIRASRILLLVLPVVMLYAGFGETFGKLWQAHILENFTLPLLANFDDIIWFGLISSVSIPMSLLGTQFVRNRLDMIKGAGLVRILNILFVGLSTGTLVFALSNNFFLTLIAIWLININMAMVAPLMQILLNQHVHSEIRATVLSISGQAGSLGEIIIGGPIPGIIATVSSVRLAMVFAGLMLLPLILILRFSGKHLT